MKFPYNLKIVFLSAFVSSQAMGMEEEKPTEFFFAAIRYYEQKNLEKASKIFKPYAGKPIPIAEPFCLDLVKFQPIPSHEESGEGKKARMYFEAAQRFPTLQTKNAITLEKILKKEKSIGNGPLVYLIGTIYEEGTPKIKADKKRAIDIFLEALVIKQGDLRALFGLKRLCSSEVYDKTKIGGLQEDFKKNSVV